MEERKLNFNAPLLSVRRFSATAQSKSDAAKGKKKNDTSQLIRRHTMPCYNPDASLDLVTEPVAVPFQWEQMPGRPKDGSMNESQIAKDVSVTPRMTRGRLLDAVKQHEGKKSGNLNASRPQLEAKSFNDKQHQGKKLGNQNARRLPIEANSFNDNVNEMGHSKMGVNGKGSLDVNDDDDDDDDDGDDDVYSDALETLSPTDSYSMNCSYTGLSGVDGLVVKPSGTFSTDPQTRDFMMSRFLPAAKAMTLDSPHYSSRKQPVPVEQPKQIVKVVSRERTTPINLCEAIVLPRHGQDVEEESEESEDEYVEYDYSTKISTRVCGFLPRICFKNSLNMLNPIPGMKVKSQPYMSSTSVVKKQNKTANSRSQSHTITKPSTNAVVKRKPESGAQSPRLVEVENKLICSSSRFTYGSERQSMSRTSSPFRRSGGISPYRSERPPSPFRGGGFLGIPKEAENLKISKLNLCNKGGSKSHELVPYHAIKRGSIPASPAVEKTVYVDKVKMAGKLYSKSGCLDTRAFRDSTVSDFKSLLKSREKEETVAAESFFRSNAKCMDVVEQEEVLKEKVSRSGDGGFSSVSGTSPPRSQQDMTAELYPDSMALVCINTSSDQTSKEDDAKNSLVQSPLPPLLPKTPSESWLWRTLPSISTQNPLSRLYRGSSFQNKRQDSPSTKWETIVKSSHLHSDHVRYSEELIPHVSQQSKS